MAQTSLIRVAEFVSAHVSKRRLPRVPDITNYRIVDRPLRLADACKADVITDGTQPCYDWDDDVIFMPSPAFFAIGRIWHRPTRYAHILLHELAHWSGHPRRLARPQFRVPGDLTYRREELVADITAALLCHDLAISKRPQLVHARYLQGYVDSLDNPEMELSIALAHANTAAGYLTAIARYRLSN